MEECLLRVNWEKISSGDLEFFDGDLTLDTGELIGINLTPCDTFLENYYCDAGYDIVTPEVKLIIIQGIINQIKPDFSKMSIMKVANWKEPKASEFILAFKVRTYSSQGEYDIMIDCLGIIGVQVKLNYG